MFKERFNIELCCFVICLIYDIEICFCRMHMTLFFFCMFENFKGISIHMLCISCLFLWSGHWQILLHFLSFYFWIFEQKVYSNFTRPVIFFEFRNFLILMLWKKERVFSDRISIHFFEDILECCSKYILFFISWTFSVQIDEIALHLLCRWAESLRRLNGRVCADRFFALIFINSQSRNWLLASWPKSEKRHVVQMIRFVAFEEQFWGSFVLRRLFS